MVYLMISVVEQDIYSCGRFLSTNYTLLDTPLTQEDIFLTKQVFDILSPIFIAATASGDIMTS